MRSTSPSIAFSTFSSVANSPSGESVIRRLVSLISAFDSTHPSHSVSALARRANLPSSTAYRLVAELLEEGLLQRDDDGRVSIGVRMWELGYRGSGVLRLRELALPFMEDVQAAVQHHTTLGVEDKGELLYVERLSGGSAAVNIAQVAGRLPLHASSSGLVLIAHSSAERQETFLASPLTRYTTDTVIDPSALRRHLAEIRQVGYASERGVIIPESSGIAVPVFGAQNEVVAALSVIVPVGHEDLVAVVPALKTAARGISRSLGWRRREAPAPTR